MRIRLLHIPLRHDDVDHAEGAELVVGVDIPADLAEARLRARTAERVPEEGISADLQAAIGAYTAAGGAHLAALRLLVEEAERSDATGLRAAMDTLRVEADAGGAYTDLVVRLHQLDEAARIAAADELAATSGANSTGSGDGSLQAPEEAVRIAAPDGAGNDGAPASHASSGVEQSVARQAHNLEVAGANPAPAPSDTPASEAAPPAAPAAEAPASAAEALAAKPKATPKPKASKAKADQAES